VAKVRFSYWGIGVAFIVGSMVFSLLSIMMHAIVVVGVFLALALLTDILGFIFSIWESRILDFTECDSSLKCETQAKYFAAAYIMSIIASVAFIIAVVWHLPPSINWQACGNNCNYLQLILSAIYMRWWFP
jgi:phosphoglycerol transferase MdoB-like AlkP superfamily enzyme